MVQKPLGASGSLRQRKIRRATLRDIMQDSWPNIYSKGRNLFSCIEERFSLGYYDINSSF